MIEPSAGRLRFTCEVMADDKFEEKETNAGARGESGVQ